MKRLVAGLFVVAACLSAVYVFTEQNSALRTFDHPQFLTFTQWQMEFEKAYSSEMELMMRFGVWLVNDALIKDTNSRGLNYTFGHNQFSDMTDSEAANSIACSSPSDDIYTLPLSEDELDVTATSIDWVSKGYVAPVQNQGGCGSCWAFASVATVEGAYVAKNKKLVKFSEQQLVDCATANYGCNGGWPYKSFQYYQKSGVVDESCYGYKGKDGSCKKSCKSYGTTKGAWRVSKGENNLVASSQKRVTAVLIYANPIMRYNGGVFDANCADSPNHAVTLVGYDAQSFKVKNSWGSRWGEKGYIRFARKGTSSGLCGIAAHATYTQF